MNAKNKKIVNIVFIISILLDLIINFFINKISQEDFDLFSTQNIITGIVMIVLIIVYIGIQTISKNSLTKSAKKKLQKAFQDNGGYEAVVTEMKLCIEKHDYKSIKELKKIVDYIER